MESIPRGGDSEDRGVLWKLVRVSAESSELVLHVVTNGRSRASDRVYETTRMVDEIV